MSPAAATLAWANTARFDPSDEAGHYESWFLRANHPSEPVAFWIRYTVLSPRGRPRDAVGELWAIVFDERRKLVHARKAELPLSQCQFGAGPLHVRIGKAVLDEQRLRGSAGELRWDLQYEGSSDPLLLLPRELYQSGFPRAKAVVGRPLARFTGTIGIGDEIVVVRDWVGSQNHNWGSRHTDRYAWGQVAGFDDAPDVFLECVTAKVKVGPFHTPWSTMVVVQGLPEGPLAINRLGRSLRAKASVDVSGFRWLFDTRNDGTRVRGLIEAPAESFAALRYGNPPGGTKTCLNTKLARCELRIERGGSARVVRTAHRAAFEMVMEPDRAPMKPVI